MFERKLVAQYQSLIVEIMNLHDMQCIGEITVVTSMISYVFPTFLLCATGMIELIGIGSIGLSM